MKMKHTRRYTLSLLIVLFSFFAGAETLIVKGAIYPATGMHYTDGLMIAVDGLITYVGEYSDEQWSEYDTTEQTVQFLDFTGKRVYPGLIALNTTLGITEIDLVRATHDFNEVGANNADVRALIAYNTDSKVVPTIRSNGIMMAEIAPRGGMISGQSSLMFTTGHNWEGSVLKADAAIHLHWPSKVKHTGWWAEPGDSEKAKNADQLLELDAIFQKAQSAYANKMKDMDAKTRALTYLFDGSKRLMVHANAAADMVDAITHFTSMGITPVIVGGKESYKITQFLKEKKISIVLVRTHSLPTYSHWEVHNPYSLPQILEENGVHFVITDQNHWQQRNLPFQAGTAIAYGLDPEIALQSVTLRAAEVLGVDELTGSLETGKQATFIVSEGDLFDMRTSMVTRAFLKGQEISLDDKQKALYREYKEKYELED